MGEGSRRLLSLFFFLLYLLPVLFPAELFREVLVGGVLILALYLLASPRVESLWRGESLLLLLPLGVALALSRTPLFFPLLFTLLFWVLLLLTSLYPSFRIPLGELPRYLLPLLLFHVSYAFVHALFLFPRNAEALASLKGLNTDVGRMVLFQSHQIRLKSLFSLSTQFAGILTVLLPFLLLWALRRKRRWIGVSALVLFALTIALAKSFGSLLEIGAVALVLFLFSPAERKTKEVVAVSSASLLFSGGLLISFFRSGELLNLSPLTLRMAHWRVALEEFLLAPLTGVGLGNFGPYSSLFLHSGDPRSKYAHNFFLQILAEGGLLLFLPLLIGLLLLLKRVKRGEKSPELLALLGSLAALLVYNLVDIGLFFASMGFLAALLLGAFLTETSTRKPVLLSPLSRIGLALLLLLSLPLLLSDQWGTEAKLFYPLDKAEAARKAEKALSLVPFNTVARSVECSSLQERGEGVRALACAERLLRDDPISLTSYRVAVGVYGKEGRWWEVLQLLEEADRRYPDLGELKPLAESLGVDRKRTR